MTDAPTPDQNRTPAPQPPLAVRRLRKLQTRNAQASPADLAERLGAIFVRDFTLVGSAQAGAQELTPDLVGTVTRNRRVAGLTQAATHLGALQQGIATYNRAATTGINTTAHVGSAQAIKTYLHGITLIYGIPAATSDDAATAVLGTDVNDLLAHINTTRPETSRGQQMNVLGAVAAIGLRNPQTLLLVKAGEQLVKAGGAVLASQKIRRDFAQQLIEQVQTTLGEPPAQLPDSTLALLASIAQDAAPPADTAGGDTPAPDTDLLELTDAEISAIDAPEPVEASPLEAPAPVAPPAEVRASTADELAAANGATAKGARLAARAFVRARSRFKG